MIWNNHLARIFQSGFWPLCISWHPEARSLLIRVWSAGDRNSNLHELKPGSLKVHWSRESQGINWRSIVFVCLNVVYIMAQTEQESYWSKRPLCKSTLPGEFSTVLCRTPANEKSYQVVLCSAHVVTDFILKIASCQNKQLNLTDVLTDQPKMTTPKALSVRTQSYAVKNRRICIILCHTDDTV